MPTPAPIMEPSQWPLIQRIFNGTPGPLLAKLSPLWKIYHVLRGTYRRLTTRLHERYGNLAPPLMRSGTHHSQFTGPLVQVGPNEYSLADKGLVDVPNLTRTYFAVEQSALEKLEESVRMANVFRYEPLIEKCNYQLLCMFANAAAKEEPLELSPLLDRYAYETMLATTTGQLAGFLDENLDAHRIQSHLKSWKFFAVLYGSYLKFHPLIAKILYSCGLRGNSQHNLFEGTTRGHGSDSTPEDASNDSFLDNHNEERGLLADDTEARIALTLAGADPAVALIRTALRYIYSDTTLLEQLREEIDSAGLSDTPLFTELIGQRSKMPLLHAVLLECIRLNPPLQTGPAYTTSEENFQVGEHLMTKDVSSPRPKHFAPRPPPTQEGATLFVST